MKLEVLAVGARSGIAHRAATVVVDGRAAGGCRETARLEQAIARGPATAADAADAGAGAGAAVWPTGVASGARAVVRRRRRSTAAPEAASAGLIGLRVYHVASAAADRREGEAEGEQSGASSHRVQGNPRCGRYRGHDEHVSSSRPKATAWTRHPNDSALPSARPRSGKPAGPVGAAQDAAVHRTVTR